MVVLGSLLRIVWYGQWMVMVVETRCHCARQVSSIDTSASLPAKGLFCWMPFMPCWCYDATRCPHRLSAAAPRACRFIDLLLSLIKSSAPVLQAAATDAMIEALAKRMEAPAKLSLVQQVRRSAALAWACVLLDSLGLTRTMSGLVVHVLVLVVHVLQWVDW
jgi:hypothetical protein